MNRIKVKLTRTELFALQQLAFMFLQFDHEPRHTVTEEVMWYTVDEMGKPLANAEQKKFTLRLYGFQAAAFVEFFGGYDLSRFPYESVLIRRIFEEIDKMIFSNQTKSKL